MSIIWSGHKAGKYLITPLYDHKSAACIIWTMIADGHIIKEHSKNDGNIWLILYKFLHRCS